MLHFQLTINFKFGINAKMKLDFFLRIELETLNNKQFPQPQIQHTVGIFFRSLAKYFSTILKTKDVHHSNYISTIPKTKIQNLIEKNLTFAFDVKYVRNHAKYARICTFLLT